MIEGYTERGTDEQLAKLYGALATSQGAFLPIDKNKTVTIQPREGRAYSFAYADLSTLITATRPALSANGLAVMTPIVRCENEQMSKVLCIIAHADGARIVATFCFTPNGDMKTLAGTQTYLKRYSYSSMLCLAADSDADDIPEPMPVARESSPRLLDPSEAQNRRAPLKTASPSPSAPGAVLTLEQTTARYRETYEEGLKKVAGLELDESKYELPPDANLDALMAMIERMRADVSQEQARRAREAVPV